MKRVVFALVAVGGFALVWCAMLPTPWFLDVTRWRVSSALADNDVVRSHEIYAEAEWGSDPSTYSINVQLLDGQRMTFWRVSPESFDSPDSLVLRRVDGHSLGCVHEPTGRMGVGMGVLSRNNSATSHLGIENLSDALDKAADLRQAMLALGTGTSIKYRGQTLLCHATR